MEEKPFHESIVDSLVLFRFRSYTWIEPRLSAFGHLIVRTKIPANHDAILAAWLAIEGTDPNDLVAQAIRDKKTIAETAKAEKAAKEEI